MSTTTHADPTHTDDGTEHERDEHESNTTATPADAALAVSCATCGSILPIDVSREWIDLAVIECPTCRSVDPIEEMLLK